MGFVCSKCNSVTATSYTMDVKSNQLICINCEDQKKPVSTSKQHLPIFTRWICKTHNCGSYNMNQKIRHVMGTCDIIHEQTVGVIKPKTFGGVNGNVSREYFDDWKQISKDKNERIHIITSWNKYAEKQQVIKERRKEHAYSARRISQFKRKRIKI